MAPPCSFRSTPWMDTEPPPSSHGAALSYRSSPWIDIEPATSSHGAALVLPILPMSVHHTFASVRANAEMQYMFTESRCQPEDVRGARIIGVALVHHMLGVLVHAFHRKMPESSTRMALRRARWRRSTEEFRFIFRRRLDH
ncbi:hypothetical protein VPH35_136360 [Triticum aestivum]|uniref:Uncharacterized protein n=1 Tax=Aegilops tauschii TaxID=37682 RepID=M8BZP3_AEGTA